MTFIEALKNETINAIRSFLKSVKAVLLNIKKCEHFIDDTIPNGP